MMKRWLAAAIAIAAAVSWYLLLPESPAALSSPADVATRVRGAIHVHTRRSDGTGTVEEVAAAARRAGLQFVIFTDHGDGTRGSDTPVYRSGVLCIDAVEISTNGGHIVALDLPESPFPLAGDVADVLEDIRRAGGVSIAAHPDSVRPELAWKEWGSGIDGIEWLNGDSAWRDESWVALTRSLFTYPLSRAGTLGALLDRPDELLRRWDALLEKQPAVALAAADAHARIGPGSDPYRRSLALHVPSYEQVFRTLSVSVPDLKLERNATSDARAVLDAIRAGRVYSSVDALASPAAFTFSASSGIHRVAMGGQVPLNGPVALRVETNAPVGASIRLLADGKVVASAAPPVLEYTAASSSPAVYRVEVDVAGAPGTPPVPWILSNPIYVGRRHAADASEVSSTVAPVEETLVVYTDGAATDWRIEKSVRSQGALAVVRSLDGSQLLFRYGLGGTLSESPYVAAVVPANPEMKRFDRVIFTARSAQPMRLTVQVRAVGEGDRRWGRSVYLDETARTVTIPFAEMSPMGTATGQPALEDVRDLLFVVDTGHARQGASGQVLLDQIQYAR
jgi:hypothetical protein